MFFPTHPSPSLTWSRTLPYRYRELLALTSGLQVTNYHLRHPGWRPRNWRPRKWRPRNWRPPGIGGSLVSWLTVRWLQAAIPYIFTTVSATPIAKSSIELYWYFMLRSCTLAIPHSKLGRMEVQRYLQLYKITLSENLLKIFWENNLINSLTSIFSSLFWVQIKWLEAIYQSA